MPYFYAPAFVEDNGIAAGTNIQHYATDESQMPNGDGVEAVGGQMEEDLVGAKGDKIGPMFTTKMITNDRNKRLFVPLEAEWEKNEFRN
jgi:hypothetical protein